MTWPGGIVTLWGLLSSLPPFLLSFSRSLSYTVSFPGDRSNAPGDRLLPSSCWSCRVLRCPKVHSCHAQASLSATLYPSTELFVNHYDMRVSMCKHVYVYAMRSLLLRSQTHNPSCFTHLILSSHISVWMNFKHWMCPVRVNLIDSVHHNQSWITIAPWNWPSQPCRDI